MVEEGTPAPDFELPDDSGNTVRLSGLRGRPVVVYFYPKDDTPGCTVQACDLRDTYGEIQERGAVVLGISPDGVESHVRFRDKFHLPFPLLADTERTAAVAYDVVREKTVGGETRMGIVRSTFVIDGDGIVAKAWYDVKPEGHADAVIEALG
jgi:peroxiredoxin Q/BCP